MVKQKQATQTYTELSQELATQLDYLEQPDLDVDAAVKAYQRGLEIVSELEQRILSAENRVEALRADSTLGTEG